MTTSATKGKVLTAVDFLRAFDAETYGGLTNTETSVLRRMLEARDAQQAAIHEEELREARAALTAIEGYDIDWTKGTGENVNAVAEIARRALGASQQTGTPPAVPRGHCGRCDRCGWPMGPERGQCRLGDCSMRPLPSERSACAGCGAPFVAAPAGSGTAETCGRCKGLKKICWDDKRDDGQTFTHFEACPDCGGSGTTKGGTR